MLINRKYWLFVGLAFIMLFGTSMNSKTKHILFFGDSITELAVKKNGFISLLHQQLDSTRYTLTGAGVGGNKVYDLYLRMENDVLAKKPDVVVIYVGINDVWHKDLLHTGTDYDKYLKFYQGLIDKISTSGSKIIVCTPSVIGEKKDGANAQDADLDKYSTGIRQLAEKNKLPLCDLRKIFAEYENMHNSADVEKGVLTVDKVHLNEIGNQLVANSLLPFLK